MVPLDGVVPDIGCDRPRRLLMVQQLLISGDRAVGRAMLNGWHKGERTVPVRSSGRRDR